MIWTPLTEKAFYKAATLHDKRYRKGPNAFPEITHLVAVASIASKYTDDEEVIAAALLHDTIEDTSYTRGELKQEFGERVQQYVLGVTIPESEEDIWTNDRKRYYGNLKAAPNESALIAAADKIHNFGTIVRDYAGKREEFGVAFDGTTEDRIHVYSAIVELVGERIPPAMKDQLESVWREYKKFVEHV